MITNDIKIIICVQSRHPKSKDKIYFKSPIHVDDWTLGTVDYLKLWAQQVIQEYRYGKLVKIVYVIG